MSCQVAGTGSAQKDELVTNNLDLVTQIVAEIACRYPRHVDRGELWNAGALGLVEASRRFNPESGIPFPRYAAIRIRGAIIDSTRTRDWAPRSLRRRMREVDQAGAVLAEETMGFPTDSQLAAALRVDAGELAALKAEATRACLLHLDQAEDGQEPVAYQVPEGRIEGLPEQMLELRELRGTLAAAVRNLPRVQSEIVIRHYLQGELLQQIAADLGVTEARASQIRGEALAALQSHFATLYEEVTPCRDDAPGRRARAAYLHRMASQSNWRSRIDAGQDPVLAGKPKRA